MSSQAWVETIYIAPGHPQCRVYAMPYPMGPNQKPADILPQHQMDWREVAKLNGELELVYIEPGYADLAGDIAGQMGGAHFEVTRNVVPTQRSTMTCSATRNPFS